MSGPAVPVAGQPSGGGGASGPALVPVGVLEGSRPAWVDRAGTLLVPPSGAPAGAGAVDASDGGAPAAGATVLEWWIGAEDRWHRPASEVAVRRHLLDGAPVVQTSLRIPGGDARVHCYGVVHEGAEWVVLDVVNDSRSPVAVAVAARVAGSAPGRWAIEGPVLRHDGRVVAVANRPADGFVTATGADALVARLGAGADALPDDGHEATTAVAAPVFAVAHGTGVRLLVATGEQAAVASAVAAGVAPMAAPAPDAVIRGWRRQLDAVCRLHLGDPAAEEEALERRCRLLLDDGATRPTDISALAAFGHRAQAAERLDRALSTLRPPLEPDEALALLVASGDVVAWSGGGDGARALAELLAGPALELAGWAGPRRRRPWSRRGRGGAAPAVDRAVRRVVAPLGDRAGIPDGTETAAGPGAVPVVPVAPVAGAVPATDGGDDGGDDGRWLLRLRRGLVVDDEPAVVDLLPGWEPDRRGRPLDVHGLPVAGGTVSFALRWHGERPALLWQFDGDRADGRRLRCPALDPAFADGRPEGEALLAAPPSAAGAN